MTPQLRFPEFTDEWQVKKLGDIGATYNGLAGKSGDDFGAGANFITYMQIFSNSKISKNFGKVKINPGEKQNTVKYGDIFFTTSSETPEETGYTSVLLDSPTDTYLNSFCFGYRADKNILSPEFARYLFHSSGVRSSIVRLAQGSTRYNISKVQMMQLSVELPPIDEQEKIADFLTAVDERIRLQEQKLVKLEQYKRGVMQQIFSQKIRFKDENGNPYPDWEEKKLKHVLKIRGERNSKNETNEVFSVAKNAGVINQIEHLGRSFASKEISNYKVVRPGDIIYTKSPTSDFPYGIIKQNMTNRTGVVSVLYGVYVPVNIYIGRILDEYFKSWQNTYNYLNPIVQKGAKNTINIGDAGFLEGRTIHLPVSEDEQQKIANFLTTLDDKITAEKSKLTAAKQFKKALLQRMFV
ncbi:MAG: restriction endonuclease subunit S [Negativicutes bacterium]|nr:restriction endonuclease subunit S [Negativicutes bacterium]